MNQITNNGWDGTEFTKNANFSLNDFMVAAKRMGVSAKHYTYNNVLYLAVVPNESILKKMDNSPEYLKEQIQLNMNRDAHTYYMNCTTFPLTSASGPLYTKDDAFSFYNGIMDQIQSYAIAVNAYKNLNPMPKYCWDNYCRDFTDLNLKRTNPNTTASVRYNYDKIFNEHVKRVAQISYQIEKNENSLKKNNLPIPDKKCLNFLQEWKNHEVDSLSYFPNHRLATINISCSSTMFDFYKKMMKNTDFIFYNNKELSYHLDDISKINANKGLANIWAKDKEYTGFVLTIPVIHEHYIAEWSLVNKLTMTTSFDGKTKALFKDWNDLQKETAKLHKFIINDDDWSNVISLTNANNVEITCDFDGSKTGEKREMDGKIPIWIKEEDLQIWQAIQDRLMQERRQYMPPHQDIAFTPDKLIGRTSGRLLP